MHVIIRRYLTNITFPKGIMESVNSQHMQIGELLQAEFHLLYSVQLLLNEYKHHLRAHIEQRAHMLSYYSDKLEIKECNGFWSIVFAANLDTILSAFNKHVNDYEFLKLLNKHNKEIPRPRPVTLMQGAAARVLASVSSEPSHRLSTQGRIEVVTEELWNYVWDHKRKELFTVLDGIEPKNPQRPLFNDSDLEMGL